MTRAILANLGFEYELAARPLSAAVRAQELRFASILRLVEGWRDAEVLPAGTIADDRELLAWGASGRARALAGSGAEGWASVDVVREANDKRFSHGLEHQLGTALPGACVVRSVDELARAAAPFGDWVAKHPFGVAGREQLRGQHWNDQLVQRAAALFATASGLVFEPWVNVDVEYSFHLDVGPDMIRRIGATTLQTEAATFRGNRTGANPPPSMWDAVDAAARAVADLGYVGPLGVDGFIGSHSGAEVWRPVVELNARWTFGRLAIELSRVVDAELTWHHPARGRQPAGLVPVGRGTAPGPGLLPEWCDPAGASGCWVELFDTVR